MIRTRCRWPVAMYHSLSLSFFLSFSLPLSRSNTQRDCSVSFLQACRHKFHMRCVDKVSGVYRAANVLRDMIYLFVDAW